MVVLSCIALIAGCEGTAETLESEGNTVVDIVISGTGSASDGLEFEVDFVSYRIACPASGLAPYDDSIEMFGHFEISETQSTPIWQFITDLPPALCTIALWVFYDDEVVCSGSQAQVIVEDGDPSTTNKFSIDLECTLSANNATGDLDIDPDFNEVHGNYCPQLIWLGATPPVITPGGPAVINVQTSSFDLDSTCGDNCDPQTCDFSAVPPTCTAGPDIGLTSTLSAPSGNGSFGDANGFDTTYTCDPLAPGPTEICVVVTDGDLECDQARCITVQCPDLCAAVDCDDGNECTGDSCDPLTGLCASDDAPDGIACDNCNSTCQLGACDPGTPFTAAVTGSSMNFSGNLQSYTATLVNPYSGASVPLNGVYNVNNTSYMGDGPTSTLLGSIFSDVLLVQDPAGTQRICGVGSIVAQSGFDVLFLADDYVRLGDMVIEGGTTPDLLWANAGNDVVRGNQGNDIMDGGPGDDVMEGGNGDDTFALWPGSGLDAISGEAGVADRVEIDAEQNQIEITPSGTPGFDFDVFYLGTQLAMITGVEILALNDASINLPTCTGSASDVCNLCGNALLNGGEECDDGNTVNGDGCADDCTSEY